MTQMILTQCDAMYQEPRDVEYQPLAFPALAEALDGVFKAPGHDEADGDMFHPCIVQLEHEVGADKGMYITIQKDGNQVLTAHLRDMCEVDALRRYCEMILVHNSGFDEDAAAAVDRDHNRQLEARHGPRPD